MVVADRLRCRRHNGLKAGVPYDGHLTLADGKGKWWEGLDPRLLYGIDLREYKGVAAAANHGWSPPPDGIFQNHPAYAKWYATWWALRMMDVVDKYQPDFIYTDGFSSQPFSGCGHRHRLQSATPCSASSPTSTTRPSSAAEKWTSSASSNSAPRPTARSTPRRPAIPKDIKSDQDWIAETPVGDWFYAPGFINDSGAVIRYLLEEVSRDGNIGVCICPLPDGSLDDSTVKMLKEIGEWMRLNGAGIYGSKAWTRLGEGADGKLNVLPGGKLGRSQADHRFYASDFRFTDGKDGNLYAYCMTVPATGTQLRITSLGTTANALGKPVKSVTLLGYTGALTWKQAPDALVVTLPDTSAFRTALGFKIETN